MNSSNDTLNLITTTINIQNIERIDIRGIGDNTLIADKNSIDNLSLGLPTTGLPTTANTIFVRGNTGDTVDIPLVVESWTQSGSTFSEQGVNYYAYTSGTTTLYIEDGTNVI